MRLIVIGGGAAGFFCAVNAARMNPSLEVVLAEKTSKLLAKVKVSGGGRCNLTHACFSVAEMSKKYPRGENFVKKTYHQFFTSDTVSWFEDRGVSIKAEADGRMFPLTDSSQTIIDCLLKEVNKYRVAIWMNREVKSIVRENEKWILQFANGEKHDADFICLASGGYPKSSMFDWIKSIGHTMEDPVPSLFTFNIPGNSITQLMGISVPEAIVRVSGTKLIEKGPLLITHWGMSGPVILRLSAWGARELHKKNYDFKIIVSWLANFNEQSLREEFLHQRFNLAGQFLHSKNPFNLPQRLWQYLLGLSTMDHETRWADLSTTKQNLLIKNLVSQELDIKGKTTFKEEFVTAGGVRLSEIDVQTMESKIVPALFFAGEVIDVDGITGGFNFQHAWTSGWIAANNISSRAFEG